MYQCIPSWIVGKDHPITIFATGEIAKYDMKDNIIDLKERGKIKFLGFN